MKSPKLLEGVEFNTVKITEGSQNTPYRFRVLYIYWEG
jgi:hypothetical protein